MTTLHVTGVFFTGHAGFFRTMEEAREAQNMARRNMELAGLQTVAADAHKGVVIEGAARRVEQRP